ncbi:energy transducer TonB [Hymenobacter convexus]|uniref:energy transducer TonB n=1 Tax=Hymenobacter sp. CA1UV-4 TaxID=3063782 RepID=UPI002713F316|nr:energy transducer TonB [Hymenobacter sp. CA1UV-4]MDO7850072.1 energy transducer TonB [Hymenobacter sp. CA1UV-4]
MMTNTQLATASLNDIVFDGRNRQYGAYQLRALYQRHVTRALVIATAIFALILVFPLAAQWLKDKLPVAPPKTGVLVNPILPPLPPETVTPPPPAESRPSTPPPPQPPTVKNVVPVVVEDKKAPEESEVPEQDELKDKASGLHNIKGDEGASAETNLDDLKTGKGNDVIGDAVAPTTYTYVEQMPELPGGGGMGAIVAAIQKACRYPGAAQNQGIEGKVYASFTVNSKGDITDVKIVKSVGFGLDEEAMRAIKTLPRFIPGKQNGREVNVSFTVPVTFKIQ